jgi:outer membrane usher protein
MKTGNRARFRWRSRVASGLFGSFAGLAAAAAPQAEEAPAVPASGAPAVAARGAGEERLYLEIVLNRVTLEGAHLFTLRDGRLFAPSATLQEIGVAAVAARDDGAGIALDDLPGAHVTYDAAEQRLMLDVPVALLAAPPAHLGYAPPVAPPRSPEGRVAGLLIDYDVYAERGARYTTVSGWNEFRLFGAGEGLWRTSAVGRFNLDAEGDHRTGMIRLDSSVTRDFPEPMVRVAVGDAFTGGLSWTRTARLGGVRVSRNFDLQPYRVTLPLASFAGDAVLPSTVDLFIDGIQQPRVPVAPGRFEVHSLPVLNGAGSAKVVLTDITGQQRTVDFSFYSSPDLLQKGLIDGSVEAGYLRRDYGVASFSYADEPFASASLRAGATRAITLESHLESTRGLVMAGAGWVSLVPGIGGVVQGSYAASRHRGRDGRQYGFGYQWQGRRLTASYRSLRRDARFRDVASLQKSLLPLRTDQTFLGIGLGRSQIGASYVRQDLPVMGGVRYAGVSGSLNLERWGTASLNLTRDLDAGTSVDAYLHWSFDFGARSRAWANMERKGGSSSGMVGVGRSLPADENGFGWRAQASMGEQAGWQAEISRLGTHGQWRAGSVGWRSEAMRSTATYADISGALLLMEGHMFAMRRVHDAFALVSTDGIGGVPVMLENRPVGLTNGAGYLLVTPLNAWQNNDLSIDPLVVPNDVNVSLARMAVVPATGSGVLARFPMKHVLAVTFSLRRADGGRIAPGSVVRIEGDAMAADVVVGYDGEVFAEDPPRGARVWVQSEEGPCVATLPRDLPVNGWLDIGVLSCTAP